MSTVIRTSTKDGVTIWKSETCTHTEYTVDAKTGETKKPPTTCQR